MTMGLPDGLVGDGDQGEAEVAEDAAQIGVDGKCLYNAKEVNDQIFEELRLPPALVDDVQNTWNTFLRSAESREAAGEAIYAAIFDSAPSLQGLFKTPRAVMAMRFMNGLNQIISQLGDPKAMKVVVETLGFQHLDLEVELGGQLTRTAHAGWDTMLNYVGGAYISGAPKMGASWATANNKVDDVEAMQQEEEAEGAEREGEGKEEVTLGNASAEAIRAEEKAKKEAAAEKEKARQKKKKRGWFASGGGGQDGNGVHVGTGKGNKESADADSSSFRNTSVPTTYNEMFAFNAAVMGFGQNVWMNEVLASFDTIVTNVSNSYRLQEECDVLSLRIAKYKGTVNLSEYKAVMLASLRSLVPKDWNSNHEVSWSWLWENVERMLKTMMGKPSVMEKALERLWSSLDENGQAFVRREVYSKFFALAPAGQDYFKQSTTRLHFIADRIVSMTLEIYKDPKKMVEDISALGLRHVGYGIPTELFGPFVTACVQVVRGLTEDDQAEEAFRWSLSLISRILTRVITEGSTIVMKAINMNNGSQVRKAVGCAPRGKRAMWMLNIQVGTQSISPLLWAIETGSLDAARAIIQDLLTIRADRDRYYYGMDSMFERHEDIVKRLCIDAPALLPTLLDGLVWRSRTTENGTRRVNYYIKHLIMDSAGNFSQAVEWVTDNGDPKLVCHPIVAIVTDTVWSRIAFRMFLMNKSWVLVTLCVFIIGTGGLKHANKGGKDETERIVVFACRCFIYLLSLGQWLYYHMKMACRDVRSKTFIKWGHLPLPAYLENYQDCASLLLTVLLLAMLACEPILHCFPHKDEDFDGAGLFTEHCPQASDIVSVYSQLSAVATIMYFTLILDLSVFSTRISAFVLVCYRVLSEVLLFMFGLAFVVLAWSCAVSALEQDNDDFNGIPTSALSLLKIALGMYSGTAFLRLHEEAMLLIAVVIYVIVSAVFLLNMLIAQLNCSYQATYLDMVGYARLNRGKIVTEAMSVVTEKRWRWFVDSLHLDERCEFGEGDIGLAGGIQVREPANANITTVDMIRRFGGSTSVLAQWPEDDLMANDEEDRFERMEKMIAKAMKRMSSSDSKKKKGGGGGSGTGGSGTGSGPQGQSGSNSGSAQGQSDHDSEHSQGE
ncbi:unnamed protein product [Prorocentrum cordatum]|uniref:Globin family profile domain-containing protein n=1 Tax=Prorocentrum cordatum TaxID=2364126 RepID=A0ABN9TPD8_9DINO|nr:unnamed protein product [Polarella glacialis]